KRGDFIPFDTINQYWQGDYYNITLREDIIASRKNVLLVAPTMGPYPGAGLKNPHEGIFSEPGMGDCFLEHVMTWLGHYEPLFNNVKPNVREIVLAGHSGGGNPIHNQMESMKARLCEIWCFDTVVGNMTDWCDFARFNKTVTLRFFHAVQFS